MSFTDETLFGVDLVDDTRWMLNRDLTYKGARDTFTVPSGYVTDFASVPRFMQWLAPATGKYTLAAVLHDHMCDALNHRGYFHAPLRPAGELPKYVTSRDVDGLFRRVMREQGVPTAQRWFMWTGVRWGALFNNRRRPGIGKDMPLVLLWSLLALPIVLPALLVILAGLGIYYAVELIAGSFE